MFQWWNSFVVGGEHRQCVVVGGSGGPKAHSIPAWGNAPGNVPHTEPRAESPPHRSIPCSRPVPSWETCLGRAFSPLAFCPLVSRGVAPGWDEAAPVVLVTGSLALNSPVRRSLLI